MNHPTRDVLADFVAENIADPDQVQQHITTCVGCQEVVAEISSVPDLLRNVPPEPMPSEVAARLDDVLAAEVQRRKSGIDQAEHEAEATAAAARTALGSFGANLPDLGNKVIRPRSAKRLPTR